MIGRECCLISMNKRLRDSAWDVPDEKEACVDHVEDFHCFFKGTRTLRSLRELRVSPNTHDCWVLFHTIVGQLKMEMDSGCAVNAASVPHLSNHLALAHVVAGVDVNHIKMSVQSLVSVSVINNHVITVTAAPRPRRRFGDCPGG